MPNKGLAEKMEWLFCGIIKNPAFIQGEGEELFTLGTVFSGWARFKVFRGKERILEEKKKGKIDERVSM